METRTSRRSAIRLWVPLDHTRPLVLSFALMQMGAEIMTKTRVGRPKAVVQLRPITVLFDPSFVARIERSRHRRRALIGIDVTLSDAVRALLEKAIAAEEQAENQAELPFTAASPESKTTKS